MDVYEQFENWERKIGVRYNDADYDDEVWFPFEFAKVLSRGDMNAAHHKLDVEKRRMERSDYLKNIFFEYNICFLLWSEACQMIEEREQDTTN